MGRYLVNLSSFPIEQREKLYDRLNDYLDHVYFTPQIGVFDVIWNSNDMTIEKFLGVTSEYITLLHQWNN